ncbi:hypothetical protein CB1_000602023 [Camelus ferus]|nr:hypothetical protein CB1_000602023 [Camelus ferus]
MEAWGCLMTIKEGSGFLRKRLGKVGTVITFERKGTLTRHVALMAKPPGKNVTLLIPDYRLGNGVEIRAFLFGAHSPAPVLKSGGGSPRGCFPVLQTPKKADTWKFNLTQPPCLSSVQCVICKFIQYLPLQGGEQLRIAAELDSKLPAGKHGNHCVTHCDANSCESLVGKEPFSKGGRGRLLIGGCGCQELPPLCSFCEKE